VVQASVGHIRDLPTKSPKGDKQPVPGVDIEHGFKPTYEVLASKSKTVADLKKAAKGASDVWFATDLDREGEAIAWHLAEVLGIKPQNAKRVVFNAITQQAVHKAFANPRPIDVDKVNAQQARRILDRIVGYQASPLLWKKVSRGLSAGRVQSVAVRLVVEREREIAAFVPDERWEIGARLSLDPAAAAGLAEWPGRVPGPPRREGPRPDPQAAKPVAGRSQGRRRRARRARRQKFALGCLSTEPRDLSAEITRAAAAVGLVDIKVTSRDNPEGKGPARMLRVVSGSVDPKVRYRVKRWRPSAPPRARRAPSSPRRCRSPAPTSSASRATHDAHGAVAVRGRQRAGRGPGRPHHLHAHGLDQPLAGGARADPRLRAKELRRGLPAGEAEHLQLVQQGRAGGPRGDPPDRRGAPPGGPA
jgi:DNA topoisomerase-1